MTDAEISRIVDLTLRTIATKDARKAYGIDCSGVNDLNLHSDVLAVVAGIVARDVNALKAIRESQIVFVEAQDMPDRVADAGVMLDGRQTVRLNARHLKGMQVAERRHVLAHEIAHVLMGHHADAMQTSAKALPFVNAAHEAQAERLAAYWGF